MTRGFVPAVRIAFGLMWAVDAALKWAPDFRDHFLTYFSADGQPGWMARYLSWWVSLLGHAPGLFAVLLALAESVLALSLLFGFKTRAACGLGALLSLAIWSTAEGLGGPYMPGSTDVGTSIAYVLVFALLWQADAGRVFGLDGWLAARVRPNRRTATATVAVTALTGLLVAATVVASSGAAPADRDATPMNGQMTMDPGGQNG